MNIDRETVRKILTEDLDMRKVCAKMVPKELTEEERSGRPATSRTEENIVNVRQIVRENRRLTVKSIAEQVNIDRRHS